MKKVMTILGLLVLFGCKDAPDTKKSDTQRNLFRAMSQQCVNAMKDVKLERDIHCICHAELPLDFMPNGENQVEWVIPDVDGTAYFNITLDCNTKDANKKR